MGNDVTRFVGGLREGVWGAAELLDTCWAPSVTSRALFPPSTAWGDPLFHSVLMKVLLLVQPGCTVDAGGSHGFPDRPPFQQRLMTLTVSAPYSTPTPTPARGFSPSKPEAGPEADACGAAWPGLPLVTAAYPRPDRKPDRSEPPRHPLCGPWRRLQCFPCQDLQRSSPPPVPCQSWLL